MATVSHHFQQQRQLNGAVIKGGLKQQQQTSTQQAQQASTPAQTNIPALARAARAGARGWEDLSDAEVLLRRWDMALEFGPCTGLTRLERWERAQKLGLSPPAYIPQLLAPVEALRETAIAKGTTEANKPITDKAGVGSHSAFHVNSHGQHART